MKVKDVMSKKKPVTIPDSATYEEAVKILYANRISGAPVVNAKGKLVGLVSEKDLFRAVHPSYRKFYKHPEGYLDFEAQEEKVKELRTCAINKFMMKDVLTAHEDDPLLKIGAIMLARSIHRMPVVGNGKIVGVVTRNRIYGNLLRHHLGLSGNDQAKKA